jgi:hypothetical protein
MPDSFRAYFPSSGVTLEPLTFHADVVGPLLMTPPWPEKELPPVRWENWWAGGRSLRLTTDHRGRVVERYWVVEDHDTGDEQA